MRQLILMVVLASSHGLDLVTRFGRQMDGEGEGGVALGLVSALQKWADSLETQTSSLRTELLKVKSSNTALEDEVRHLKSFNLNLQNDVSQTGEKTRNLKTNYQKAIQQLNSVNQEQKELKNLMQQQGTIIKTQQRQIQDSKEEINSLRTLLSSTSSNLSSLEGKTEALSESVTNKFVELPPILKQLSSSLHDLKSNTSTFQSTTSSHLAELSKVSTKLKETAASIRQEMTETDRENMVAVQDIVTRLDTRLRADVDKLMKETKNMETENSAAMTTLTGVVDRLGGRIEDNMEAISNLTTYSSEARSNLNMIKSEIKQSVSFLTGEMERNVTRTVKQLEEVKYKVEQGLDTLASKSSYLTTELNKLKSHTQRSVDESSGVSLKIVTMEGKLSDVMTANAGLEEQVVSLSRNLQKEKEERVTSMQGIQILGDSLADIKGEIMGKDLKGGVEHLQDKTLALERSVAELSVKAAQSQQDTVRNTGRINKVEQDIGNIQGELDEVREEQETLERDISEELSSVTSDTGSIREDVEELRKTLTTTRNAVAEVMTKQAGLESERAVGVSGASNGALASTVQTLKTNVIGLGNYINSINREVNSLAIKTKESLENLNRKVEDVTATVDSLDTNTSDKTKSGLDFNPDDFVASSVKNDVAGLSSQLYTLKTSVFELTGDVTGVKTGLQSLTSDVATINNSLQGLSSKVVSGEQGSKTTRAEISTIRSGLSGLTNTVFAVKTQLKAIEDIEERMEDLAINVTGVANVLVLTRQEVAKLKPDLDFIMADVTSMRDRVSRMTDTVTDISNPARFSCGVTGDELKISGVITYDECSVNYGDMMNMGTGHATVPSAGDYILSFTANMVSSNSQAIWCALYKQSPGDEGWQVLGMINNYQKDAGEEDDRDSGSLTILTSLAEGDQVWVEWRGYGESFLYSNPYKLISFSGFRISRPNDK